MIKMEIRASTVISAKNIAKKTKRRKRFAYETQQITGKDEIKL